MVDSDRNCDVVEIPETWRPRIFILSIALVILAVFLALVFREYANAHIELWFLIAVMIALGASLLSILPRKPNPKRR